MAKDTLLSEKALIKKYGAFSTSVKEVVKQNKKTLRLPTRVLWFNHITGGGYVYGRVHEIFGYESTGKSLLAKEAIYSAQALGGVGCWIDAEQCFDPIWTESLGITLDRLYVYDSNDLEGMSDWIRDMAILLRSKLVNNEPIVFVLDSIAATEIDEEIGADQKNEKGKYGMGKAKKFNEFYRKRISFLKKYGIILICINQVRKKVNASLYENATVTPGGDATRFYASMRGALHSGKVIKGRINSKGKFKEDKKDGIKYGRKVRVEIEKNKTHPLMNSINTQAYFRQGYREYVGFDRYSGLPSILMEEGILKKKGTRYYYKGNMLANGEEALIDLLHVDSNIRSKLLKKSDIFTISKAKNILEVTKNLYPVKIKSPKDEEDEE